MQLATRAGVRAEVHWSPPICSSGTEAIIAESEENSRKSLGEIIEAETRARAP